VSEKDTTPRKEDPLKAAKLAPGYRDDPNFEPEFYYSRERRLAHTSAQVRELNEAKLVKKGGLVRALTGTRGNTMIFITIILLSVFITIASRTIYKDSGAVTLGENSLTISARRVSGTAYIEVKKKAQGDSYYTGPVEMAVSIPQKKGSTGEEPSIETFQFFFTLEPEEEFRRALPFDAPELLLILRAGETYKTVRVKAE
jgi:hypothetical protein